jgi:hypothetical protein
VSVGHGFILNKTKMIELDQLLHDNCTPQEIADFFKGGEFHEEHYLIKAIKQHLLTPAQRQEMFEWDFDIADMLNGRVGGAACDCAGQIFDEWNRKLGFQHFGY